MNIQQFDVLRELLTEPCGSQRELSARCGHSLGAVNAAVQELTKAGLLQGHLEPTAQAFELGRACSPGRAVILAAGSGRRMTPIHLNTSKAFLEVSGEPLIERLIRQLQEAGICEIYIVVGFMKEQFEYLMDQYHVELIVNPEYEEKNNLFSARAALPYLSNAYLLPCDLGCRRNPVRKWELYSWYMVTEEYSRSSMVRVNRKAELVESAGGNSMIGISYLAGEAAEKLKQRILRLCDERDADGKFWEEALFENHRMAVPARLVDSHDFTELNTYEQLRNLDSHSRQLQSEALTTAAAVLGAKTEEICHISAVKDGITNRSFLFSCRDKKYIMRVPRHSTQELSDYLQEAENYRVIAPSGVSDRVLYLNHENGWKLAEYIESARLCNPQDRNDVKKCMAFLRNFHALGLKVPHRVDLFHRIDEFEKLRNGPSAYRDYEDTRKNVFSLRPYIEACREKETLTHMDAVPDNFLLFPGENGTEQVRLIDWECGAMQDPHVDIAMFCVYSLYKRNQVDETIDAYFPEGCSRKVRIKIYCYIAVCGLLWSNWCEYKQKNGVRFGEYSLRQYRFAKDYYRIAREEMKKGSDE